MDKKDKKEFDNQTEEINNIIDENNENDKVENKSDTNQKSPDYKEKEVDERSFSEKVEDKIDDVVYGAQKIIYGDIDNYSENIPAMIRDPDNEIRHINKVQTRRNFNKWLFGKKGAKVFFTLVAIALVIGLIVSFVG